MNTVGRPINFRLDHVQPCTDQHRKHEIADPLLETTVPRKAVTDIYVALCQCSRCHELLVVAAGHVPETEESMWQISF